MIRPTSLISSASSSGTPRLGRRLFLTPATGPCRRHPCGAVPRSISSSTAAAAAGSSSSSPLGCDHHHRSSIFQHQQVRAASSSASSNRWIARQAKDRFVREAKVQGLKSRAAFKLLELHRSYKLFKKGQLVVDLGFAPGSWSQVAMELTKPTGRVLGIDVIPAQPPRGVSSIQGNFLSPSVQRMVKKFVVEVHLRQVGDAARLWERAEGKDKAAAKGGGRGRDPPRPWEEEDGVDEEELGDLADDEGASYIDQERRAWADRERAAKDELENKKLVDIVISDMMMNTSGNGFRDHMGSMELCEAALSFAEDTLRPGGHFVCKFYQGSDDRAFERKLNSMFARVHRVKPDASRKESKEGFFVALRRKKEPRIRRVGTKAEEEENEVDEEEDDEDDTELATDQMPDMDQLRIDEEPKKVP